MKKMKKKNEKKETDVAVDSLNIEKIPNLSGEQKKNLEDVSIKLDKFKKKVISKFGKYIIGMTYLPFSVSNSMQGKQPFLKKDAVLKNKAIQNPNTIHVLVLVDDSASKKMSKLELKDKIVVKVAKEVDKNIFVEPIILSELWQSCYDGKHDIVKKIALGLTFYDKGVLSAVKISEIHKEMVLRKFEKYIVAYVLAGSIIQGKATKDSDIDVFLVIDDTDVRKMTRVELKDKLRAIIIGMGMEAGDITNIKNKINIQVYILTDFWTNIKDANPIIFTFLRDGIPLYDRGIFMPWKQLLRMGRIKPSQEAIDLLMNSGEHMMKTVNFKLKSIGMEDIFYATLTPSQASLMLYGLPPPTPKETPSSMREIFVKKEKMLEEKYVKILETNIEIRKSLEHGSRKNLTGKELDSLLKDTQSYIERIKKLFVQIENLKDKEKITEIFNHTKDVLRKILVAKGAKKVTEADILPLTKEYLVETGKMPSIYLKKIEDIIKIKKSYDTGKVTKNHILKIKKSNEQLHRYLVSHIERERANELKKICLKVKYGKKYGEVIILNTCAYIIHDVDAKIKEINKATISKEGGFDKIVSSSVEELEKSLLETKLKKKFVLQDKLFSDLKGIFGKNVEILF